MRISDWSSDVCSSYLELDHGRLFHRQRSVLDLREALVVEGPADRQARLAIRQRELGVLEVDDPLPESLPLLDVVDRQQIGRASCRERVCKYVEISVVGVA